MFYDSASGFEHPHTFFFVQTLIFLRYEMLSGVWGPRSGIWGPLSVVCPWFESPRCGVSPRSLGSKVRGYGVRSLKCKVRSHELEKQEDQCDRRVECGQSSLSFSCYLAHAIRDSSASVMESVSVCVAVLTLTVYVRLANRTCSVRTGWRRAQST